MTNSTGDVPPLVKVHVDNFPAVAPKDRTSTFVTKTLVAGVPVMILGHAPTRRRAVISIVGQSTDVVYLCGSSGDAQHNEGAMYMGLQVAELTGSDEVWAVSATAPAIGVVAEYAAPGA